MATAGAGIGLSRAAAGAIVAAGARRQHADTTAAGKRSALAQGLQRAPVAAVLCMAVLRPLIPLVLGRAQVMQRPLVAAYMAVVVSTLAVVVAERDS